MNNNQHVCYYFRYLSFNEHIRNKIADGSFENSDAYKQKQQYLKQLLAPKSSEQLKEEKERDRTFMDAMIKIRELLQ